MIPEELTDIDKSGLAVVAKYISFPIIMQHFVYSDSSSVSVPTRMSK